MQSSLRNNALWMIAASSFSQVFGFIAGIILARILYPEAFGIIATVAIYNGIIGHFVGGGLGDAIIKQKQVERQDYDLACSFQAIFCLLAFVLICSMSTLLSSIHNLPELQHALPLAATTFLLRPFTNIAAVKLKVENKFNHLAKVSTARSILTGSLAIIFALSGFDFYALIISGLISSSIFIPVLFKAAGWVPKPYISLNKGKHLLNPGAGFTINTVAGYINEQLPRYAASVVLGSHFLGIYARAESLCKMPIDLLLQSFSQPAFRKMAILGRPQQLDFLYRSTQLLLIYIGPIFVAMSIFGKDAIPIVYGEPWRQAGEIISFLAPYFIILLVMRPMFLLMVTNNLLDKVVKISIEQFILSLCFLLWIWDHSISQLLTYIIITFHYSLFRKCWVCYKQSLFYFPTYLIQLSIALGFVACYAFLLASSHWLLTDSEFWFDQPVLALLEMFILSVIILVLTWLVYPAKTVRHEVEKARGLVKKYATSFA